MTIGAQLELIAKVAPLKDLLCAYLEPSNSDYYENRWNRVESWDEFDDLGRFVPDEDEDEGLYLPGTLMMLVGELAEPTNAQALLIQPYHNGDYFKRAGWLIQKETNLEDDSGETKDFISDWVEDFEPMRKYFKFKRPILV